MTIQPHPLPPLHLSTIWISLVCTRCAVPKLGLGCEVYFSCALITHVVTNNDTWQVFVGNDGLDAQLFADVLNNVEQVLDVRQIVRVALEFYIQVSINAGKLDGGRFVARVAGTRVPFGPQPYALVISGNYTGHPTVCDAEAGAPITFRPSHTTLAYVLQVDRFVRPSAPASGSALRLGIAHARTRLLG